MRQPKTITERFWEKVDKTPGHGPDGDCWVWTASTRGGYGHFHVINGDSRDLQMHSHKFSYLINNGGLPKGICVRHTCDNRLCVKPSHLLCGSQADNVNDMIVRKRNNPPRKLTESDVIKIIELLNSGHTHQLIGNTFGISKATIGQIHRGVTWKHLTRPEGIVESGC